MSETCKILKDPLKRAINETVEEELIHNILPHLSTLLITYLRSQKENHDKLRLILKLLPNLQKLMDGSFLVRSILEKAGQLTILALICREICYYAESLSKLIEQSAYSAVVLQEFPFSGFPILIGELPNFFKKNLITKYEEMQKKYSEPAAKN
jgi:hypothetical protein